MSTADLFFQLQVELVNYKPAMTIVSDKILNEELSEYPIFVLHKQETKIGLPIIESKDHNLPWSVNISTYEEFCHKDLIKEEKREKFLEVFKDPSEFFCVFVVSSLGAQFVFIPR